MAATYQSDVCASTRPPVTSGCPDLVAVRGVVTAPVTLALNETLQMVPLPEGCVPVDCILECDQLDIATTGPSPAITLTVGLMTSDLTDLEASTYNLITDSTLAQTGGVARMDLKSGLRYAKDDDTLRYIGIKITAAAATKQAGSIALTLFYRNA
jgi:hypothetical protein